MASQLSPYADQAILNSLFAQTSNFGVLATPPAFYVALSTTTPAISGGAVTNVTEPSGGGYARVATTSGSWGSATEAAPAVLTNTAAVTFPVATADWSAAANMTYAVLYDAASVGNCLGFAALTTAKPVLNGDTASFPAGAIVINLT